MVPHVVFERLTYDAVEFAKCLGALDLDAAPESLSKLQSNLEPINLLHISLLTFFMSQKHIMFTPGFKPFPWKTRSNNLKTSINGKKTNKNHFTPIIELTRARKMGLPL
jgi:hypothetical protein